MSQHVAGLLTRRRVMSKLDDQTVAQIYVNEPVAFLTWWPVCQPFEEPLIVILGYFITIILLLSGPAIPSVPVQLHHRGS